MNGEKIRKLVEFDCPTVANGLERLKVRDATAGYTGPDIRALTPELCPQVGIAVTARLDTTSPGVENATSLFDAMLRLIAQAAAAHALPVFVVIESVGPRPRHTVTIGDGMATLMRLAGATAFLTNGSIRDIAGVRQVPLACWAAGLSPMHGELRWLDVNTTVVIDGMTVRPGEILHADENGVLLIPAQVADQVYDQALAVRQEEQALFARWRAPEMTLDAYLKHSQ